MKSPKLQTVPATARPRVRGAAVIWLILVVLALGAGGVLFWQKKNQKVQAPTTIGWTAAREKLRISVVESGQLKAAKSVDIYCKVEGGATILELIDEGTRVQKDDVLIRLDASNLDDELTAQQIKTLNAEAAKIQAEKTQQIQESMNQSDVDQADLDLKLAVIDLKKYVEGDYLLATEQADADITLADSEKKNAEQQKRDTAELVQLDFAAQMELDADTLDAERAVVKHRMAQRQKEILQIYEMPREKQVLESAVDQKRDELERVKLRCEADLAQKIADAKSKLATYELEKGKLEDLTQQLGYTVITAPADGLAVYPMNQSGMGGRGGSDRDRVEEGATAREHQLLLSLPDTSEMVVVVSIHESSIDKLKLGQPAIVTIDAIADMSFVGRVTFIAPLPDSQNQWLNPDLKVYRCEIALGGDTTMLRPGMSAAVEIVVDEIPDTIAVPIHAVHREGDRYYVYVDGGAGVAAVREVKIGLHNDQRVAIAQGLEQGERIFLAVPPDAPQPDFPEDPKKTTASSVDELRQQADKIASKLPEMGREERNGEGPGGPGGPSAGFNMADAEKFKNMTPEEQKKAYQDMLDKMTPEEKAKWEERAKRGFGGERGDRGEKGDRGDRGSSSGRGGNAGSN